MQQQTSSFILAVPFSEGMTAQDAIQLSGIGSQVELPEPLQLGIFGVRLKDLQQAFTGRGSR